jgi:penicillin-binding protein 1C
MRLAAAFVLAALVAAVLVEVDAPPPSDFAAVRDRYAPSEAVLLDRHGVVLHERRVDPHGRRLAWTPLPEIAPALVASVIEAEDRRFRSHAGIDGLALLGAARDAVRGRVRGASTISMQLAALLDPVGSGGRGRRGLAAKLRQMRGALALERRWSKDEILEAYLNLATFRGELAGVASAARGLFDREPDGLGEGEGVLLAALLRAPNAEPAAVAARACAIAARRPKGIGCSELEARSARLLGSAPVVRPRAVLAPHLAARLLRPGAPARVATTLDAEVQRLVADVLARQVLALREHNVRDAAALVVDNPSGDVLAWVGGTGSLSSACHVDGVRARRQAGSTLKPFLYARALDRRLVTAAGRLDDAPLDVVTALGSYRPANYDRTFRGPVPVRAALASSLNVPAVRVLEMVGVDDFVSVLGDLGFAGLRDPDFYGDSLALGSADVSLLELVGAYRALAVGGLAAPLRVDPTDAASPARRVFSPEATFVVGDVLADRASRAPAFGFETPLAARVWSAAKTGTSVDMRDNWCLGFTSRFTVGVWVGNLSGASMWDVSGVDGAAPAWLEIVHALHRDRSSEAPTPPAGLVREAGEWFLRGSEPPASPPRAAPGAAPRRILAPLDGTLLARDPDIPDARERIWIEAEPRDPRLALRLDGREIGTAATPLLWPLSPGRHELALLDETDAQLDVVSFTVR